MRGYNMQCVTQSTLLNCGLCWNVSPYAPGRQCPLTGDDSAADVGEERLVGGVRADDALHGVVDAELDGAVGGLT